MHWTERQRARVAIGLTLQSRGWRLYGFHEDRSDAMTDYYSPASWDGVAEKDGCVVVVDVSKSNNYVLSRSGGRQTQRQARGDDCAHCRGSGLEPDGWTFDQAKADPRGFNRTWTGQGVALLPDVVSPLHFDGQGRQKCTKCSGQGHTWKLEPCVEPWPTFGANPSSRLWHVEKDGRILASGVGLGPCADYDSQRAQAAVEQIVRRIEDAMYAGPALLGTNADVAATIRHNHAHNGIEVVFGSKPAETIRSALKALGFRWSQRQGLWYARHTPRTWERVHALLGEAETPEAMETEPDLPGEDAPADTKVPHYVIEEPLTGRIVGGNGDDPNKPEPEPWQMTRFAYQKSKAMTAGGVPILNAQDGRDHEAAVRRAADASLPVPPEVLAEYGLLKADIVEAVDVYGRKCQISRHDLESGWEQIRLYCNTTDKLLADLPEWHAARKAQGGATTIHRENIAQVLAATPPTAQQEAADVTPTPLADAGAVAPAAEPPPLTAAVPEAAALPQSTSWTILTSLKWKNGHPVAPHGIIKAHNGDGKVHHLTPWADGLWCMTCSSESCPATGAVLTTKPAPKGKGAQVA